MSNSTRAILAIRNRWADDQDFMVGRLTVISPLLRVPGTGCPSSGASPRPLHALREDRPAPPGRHSGTNGNARVCFVCFPRFSLVLCLLNGWCFAARIFPSRRGASDEHIPQWICKERATKPGAKRTAALWVAPSLACGFVARRSQPHCGGCSLLAPRHRPNWAQQNTSHLGDTTLDRRHSARAKAFALLRGRVLRMRLWEVKGVFVLIASGPCVNLTAHCSGC